MKRSIIQLAVIAALLIIWPYTALADWSTADGHKMHEPQLPDEAGWDVQATFPVTLADDWTCSETGWIKDIHFWGSWLGGVEGNINFFTIKIHADIPANPPEIPYSRPGLILWEEDISTFSMVSLTAPTWEGWYDPPNSEYYFNDHLMYYQYNVFLDSTMWYWQTKDTIYWLSITAHVAGTGQWGWKSSIIHHKDDAVWGEDPNYAWIDLWEPPDFTQSLDLAFVITGEPGEPIGACCYSIGGPVPNNLCVQTTAAQCATVYVGIYQGDGTICQGMEACCLPDGSCIDADAICCVNELGGTPQGSGTACSANTMACCLTDGSCVDVDPLCCDDLGGMVSPFSPVCLGDMDGDGVDDGCEGEYELKWEQFPDLASTGMDVSAYWHADFQPYILADDFPCWQTGPIREIHVWASWYLDYLPGNDPANVWFTLSIHADIPATMNPYGPYSMPGEVLWFDSVPFTVSLYADDLYEGWFEPPDDWIPFGDSQCWEYVFYLDSTDFIQEGSETDTVIYWLDLQAHALDDSAYFGWKISNEQWNDDAAWTHGVEPLPTLDPPWQWWDLHYPDGHPLEGQTLDLAFQIWGETGEPPVGACCYGDFTPGNLCVVTTEDDCLNNYFGVYLGDNTICQGMEACCLPDGNCVDADAACCLATLGGMPQGPGTSCSGITVACCLTDGSCVDVEPICCDDLGGYISPYSAGCLGDIDNDGIDDACQPPYDFKWEQPPDLDSTGMDVSAFWHPEYGPYILADDFPCWQYGPIREIHIYGSWWEDYLPDNDPSAVWFTLSIHEDIPAALNPYGPYSMPGDVLWVDTIPFTVTLYADNLYEGWLEPPDFWNPFGDSQCWKYVFELDSNDFIQEGSVEDTIIYWLDLQAHPLDTAAFFGWKTSLDHWNDDAAWTIGVEPLPGGDPPHQWWPLVYPLGHPYEGQTIDLAFEIWFDEEEPPTGACCYPDPSVPGSENTLCIITTQNDCENNLGGAYEGDGTSCQGMQACCLPNGDCVDADALCCVNELGGTPQGSGTVCSGVIVACCLTDGSCVDVDTVCCDDLGGVAQGSGTSCSANTIACCLTDGSCLDVDPLCCDELGGFISPYSAICLGDNNGNTIDDACEEPPEACCMPDGDCIDIGPSDCAAMGGIPQGAGTSCSANTIACCLADGSCLDVDPLCCDEMGGVSQGSGSQCTNEEACCLPSGDCIMADPLCCDDLGGTPQGLGTACSANTIACCLSDGSCTDVDPLCCDDLGGFISTYSTFCLGDADGNNVDDACEEPSGACCFDDGTCSNETAADCQNLAGDYMGDGTRCLGDSDSDGKDDICVDPWPNHKMHHPQLPDPRGWDVNATNPVVLADDWRCTKSGNVKDIHFWGSWLDDEVGDLQYFVVSIHEDIPANPPQVPYSRPGPTLLEFEAWDFEITTYDPTTMEGWYDPRFDSAFWDNHQAYYRYDVYLEEDLWFWQEEGTIYWLNISAVVGPGAVGHWGWKSSQNRWNDDAVWGYSGELNWIEMYEPARWKTNTFEAEMGPGNTLISGFGSGAYGEGFYYYESGWWNIWFYDDPYVFGKKEIYIDLFAQATDSESWMTVAMNYSTDVWSLDGNPPGERRPPLPWDLPEDLYIERDIFFDDYPSGPYMVGYVIPDYNPEWVSIDIMGQNFMIETGQIMHRCRPSLNLAFVITSGPPCVGICGDANNDGVVNVSDAVLIINYVFVGGGPPRPVLACGDANNDCVVNVSDAVWIINYVFVGGGPPGDCCPGGALWLDGDCCPFVSPGKGK